MADFTWTALFIHIGSRGPRWFSLAVPWTLLSLCFIILGHCLRRSMPTRELMLEFEEVCLVGAFLTVVLRAASVKRLLVLLLWPSWRSAMLTPEAIVSFSVRCVIYSVDLTATTAALGCLATYTPLLRVVSQPFVHVLEAEALDLAFLAQLYRSDLPLPIDVRLPLFVLDGVVGAAAFAAAPLAVYILFLFIRVHTLNIQTWRARRRSVHLQKDLTSALAKLLTHEGGSSADVLRSTQDVIFQQAVELAVRKKIMEQMEKEIQTASRLLAESFRNAPPPSGSMQVRLAVKPSIKASWQTRRVAPVNAPAG